MKPLTRLDGESRALSVATVVFFVAFLLVGVAVYRDYGLSWDEVPTREFGVMNVQHAVPDLRTLDSLRAVKGPAYERFGPLYEMLLVRAENLLGLGDMRQVFFMRHLVNFCVFVVGVLLFHRLCRRRFSRGISLASCVCLATSPQLFAHAFYNTKDISFLTAFVAGMLALDSLLSRPSWRSTLVHAVATGALLGTRVLGFYAVVITAAAALARRPTRRTLLYLLAYGVVVIVLLPVVWPVLRIDPFGIVKDAVLGATTNPYTRTNLFRGAMIPATDLPWDYVPTWIFITTPLALSALFVVGVARALATLLRHPRESLVEHQQEVIVLAWFFGPVLGAVVLRPVMYDAWRHLFFVYPAFIYLAAMGMETLLSRITAYAGEARRRVVAGALTAALALSLSPALAFMVRNHPFEHLYFNRLAGRDMSEVKQRFELDYWGLSYRTALEHLLTVDSSSTIRVHAANFPGLANSLLLPPRDRARLRFVSTDAEADYFMTNYRFHPGPYAYPREAFSVRVGNASIATVFHVRSSP